MPANLMVRDLMNASRGWNSALIKSNFLSIDADAILGLPPPSCLHPVSLWKRNYRNNRGIRNCVRRNLRRETISMIRKWINMNEIRFGDIVSSSRNRKERYMFKKHNMTRYI
ncbi:hypothetical protein ACOSP7_005058 [Xanthoceras sorbifolium]